MKTSNRIEVLINHYKKLAQRIVAHQVRTMEDEFPEENFPVRPAYRKAMYHRLIVITDELQDKMNEMLKGASKDENLALTDELAALQQGYAQDFIRQVRKEAKKNYLPA